MKYIDKPKRYEKEDYIITAIILNTVLNGVSFQLESLIFNNTHSVEITIHVL